MTSMRRFATHRLATGALSLLGVTLIAFALTNVVPSDPAAIALGPEAANDPAAVQAYKQRHGLDKPLPEQYVDYMKRLFHGDLGVSRITGRPVRADLEQFAPASFELGIVAALVALVFGVFLGTVGALLHNCWPDQVIRVGSLVGVSMPVFWLALVAFYLFSFKLGIFPGLGRLPPGAAPPPHLTGMYTFDALVGGQWGTFWQAFMHVLLPALVLAAHGTSLLTRFTRSAVLDVLGQDFVRTARSKGLPKRRVAVKHILTAALVPIVTVSGVLFGVMLAGTVFVESIFAWPGIGEYSFQSATNLDLPAILGVTLLIATIYIAINIVVDLLYGLIDPRIRLG